MNDTASAGSAARAARRIRRAPTRFLIMRWMLAAGAVVLATLWLATSATSHHSTPLYNDWLVILVLYAVFWMLAQPRLVFHRTPAPHHALQRDTTLRASAAYLVAILGGAWIIAFPGQSAEVSPVAAITRIDARKVAILSYNRVGARGLLQMAFGIGSERVVAVDLDTGHHLWDVEISKTPFVPASVLGDDGEFVYVENFDGIHPLRLTDGSLDDARDAPDEITDAWTAADASPSGTDDIAVIGESVVRIDGDALEIRNDENAEWPRLGTIPNADDIETTTTIVIDPITHRHSTLTVYDDEYWREQPTAVGSSAGYLVAQRETYITPLRYDRTLFTIDLATGHVIDAVDIPTGARGGMTADSGASIVTLDSPLMSTTDLVMIAPDGTISLSTIGRTGFFSEAL